MPLSLYHNACIGTPPLKNKIKIKNGQDVLMETLRYATNTLRCLFFSFNRTLNQITRSRSI